MPNQQELTWQLHDSTEWRFGALVRGVVREPYLAEIYFDEGIGFDGQGSAAWVWFVQPPPEYWAGTTLKEARGREGSFGRALDRAEAVLRELGIITEGEETK